VARARKHKENCVFKALQLNSRRCARQFFFEICSDFQSDGGGGGITYFGCQNRAARNSFQLKASLMDLRACADSASFTEKKAEKVQWFLRSVSL
jgi:hypothetical protein